MRLPKRIGPMMKVIVTNRAGIQIGKMVFLCLKLREFFRGAYFLYKNWS